MFLAVGHLMRPDGYLMWPCRPIKGTLLAAVGQIYETKMAEFQAVPRVPLGGACLAGHAKGTVIARAIWLPIFWVGTLCF